MSVRNYVAYGNAIIFQYADTSLKALQLHCIWAGGFIALHKNEKKTVTEHNSKHASI